MAKCTVLHRVALPGLNSGPRRRFQGLAPLATPCRPYGTGSKTCFCVHYFLRTCPLAAAPPSAPARGVCGSASLRTSPLGLRSRLRSSWCWIAWLLAERNCGHAKAQVAARTAGPSAKRNADRQLPAPLAQLPPRITRGAASLDRKDSTPVPRCTPRTSAHHSQRCPPYRRSLRRIAPADRSPPAWDGRLCSSKFIRCRRPARSPTGTCGPRSRAPPVPIRPRSAAATGPGAVRRRLEPTDADHRPRRDTAIACPNPPVRRTRRTRRPPTSCRLVPVVVDELLVLADRQRIAGDAVRVQLDLCGALAIRSCRASCRSSASCGSFVLRPHQELARRDRDPVVVAVRSRAAGRRPGPGRRRRRCGPRSARSAIRSAIEDRQHAIEQFAVLAAGRFVVDGRQVAEDRRPAGRRSGPGRPGRGRAQAVQHRLEQLVDLGRALLVQDAGQQQDDFAPFGDVQPRGRPTAVCRVLSGRAAMARAARNSWKVRCQNWRSLPRADHDAAVHFLGRPGTARPVPMASACPPCRGPLAASCSAAQRLGTWVRMPSGWFCMGRASSCSSTTVRSAFSRPGRCSRDRDSQRMIDSYRSARCSGSRRSFQCTTARAVSITGLRAMRRMSGRSRRAASSSVEVLAGRLAAVDVQLFAPAGQERRHGLSESGSIRAWAKSGRTTSPVYAAGRLVTTKRQPR